MSAGDSSTAHSIARHGETGFDDQLRISQGSEFPPPLTPPSLPPPPTSTPETHASLKRIKERDKAGKRKPTGDGTPGLRGGRERSRRLTDTKKAPASSIKRHNGINTQRSVRPASRAASASGCKRYSARSIYACRKIHTQESSPDLTARYSAEPGLGTDRERKANAPTTPVSRQERRTFVRRRHGSRALGCCWRATDVIRIGSNLWSDI